MKMQSGDCKRIKLRVENGAEVVVETSKPTINHIFAIGDGYIL